MPGNSDVRWKIVEAALALAAERGWRRVTLTDIAERSGEPPAEIPSKLAILHALNRHVDAAMLDEPADQEGSVKDKLFELLMRRLDVLIPHRAGLRAVLQGTVGVDPVASLTGLCALHRSMGLALEAAGVSSSGQLGHLRAKALGAIYLRMLSMSLRGDPTSDRVMAELDKALTRCERLAQMIDGRRGLDRQHDARAQSAGG